MGHPFFSSGSVWRRNFITSLQLGRTCCASTKQVPGFAIFLEVRAVGSFCAFGIEADVGEIPDLRDRDDVPGIVSDDVSGDEVDFVSGVWNDGFMCAGTGDANAVSPAGGGKNRFDLNAKDAAIGLDDHVVGFAVAVGLADGESHAGGFDDEDQFRDDAFAFGIECGASDGLALAARLSGRSGIFCHKRRMRRGSPGAQFSF
jgi:hypothetical protein